MKIKYFGTSWETGMTLTAKIYDSNGQEVGTGHTMTETAIDSAIYHTEDISEQLTRGIYAVIIIDDIQTRLGFNEFAWDGNKEVDLTTIDVKLWTPLEKMEIRDSLGVTGDKSVASGGQLQKKSESPHNDIIDTTTLL